MLGEARAGRPAEEIEAEARRQVELAGLEAARRAGFSVSKLNAVLLRSFNGDALAEIVALAVRHQLSEVKASIRDFGRAF